MSGEERNEKFVQVRALVPENEAGTGPVQLTLPLTASLWPIWEYSPGRTWTHGVIQLSQDGK